MQIAIMSKQLEDSINREIMNASFLVEKGKNEMALEKLNKAEKLAEKAKSPNLLCRVLHHKGEVLDSMDKTHEALLLYEKALEKSLNFMLNEPQDSSPQSCLKKSIDLIGNIFQKTDNVLLAEESYERINKYFDEAVNTYEKLIYEQPEKLSFLSNYLSIIDNLRGYFLVVGKSEKQIQLINSAIDNLKKILKAQPDNLGILAKLDSFVKELGEEFLGNEFFEDAERIFKKLQEIYMSLLKTYPDNELVFHYLISSSEYLGNLYSRQGYLDKIEENYQPALSILEENLRKNPENTASLENMGKIYEKIGTNYSEAKELEKANLHYEKALVYYEKLIGKYLDDLDYQEELAEIFSDLGNLFETINHIENAEKCYLHKIEINEALFEEDPKDIDLKMDIVNTLLYIGNLYAKDRNNERAKNYYERAIQGYEMLLSENPEATEFEIYISDVFIALGDMYANVGNENKVFVNAELETAREYYEKALKLNENEFERNPDDVTCREELVRTLGKLGDLFVIQNRYEDAIPVYNRIIEIEEQSIEDDPFFWLDITPLTNLMYLLGSYYGKVGKTELEKEQYSRATKLYSRLLHDEEIYLPTRKSLALDVQTRGIEFLKSGKFYAADEAINLALEFFRGVFEEDPENRENYPYICEALYQRGKLQITLGNYEEAAKTFETLLPIMKKLIDSKLKNPNIRETAGVTYTNIGEMYSLIGEDEKSKQAFENGLAIIAALRKEDPDNSIYIKDQTEAFEHYSKLLDKLGRNEKSEDFISD
jgi:tetratricopeptide (TPR) repeat protein